MEGIRKKERTQQKLNGIIRNTKTLFEQEEDYYEPKRVNNFEMIITSNMKVMVIKIDLNETETYLRNNFQNSEK